MLFCHIKVAVLSNMYENFPRNFITPAKHVVMVQQLNVKCLIIVSEKEREKKTCSIEIFYINMLQR